MEIIPTDRRRRGRRWTCWPSGCAPAHVVPLLADRDLSARGVEVTFFGGRTRMPAGPALLALRTGAPLLRGLALVRRRTGPRRGSTGRSPVPRPETGRSTYGSQVLTQPIADQLAEGIAEHPEDWHMLQRLWLDRLPDARPLAPPGRRRDGLDAVRIGIVCPYSFDVPGGVQNHVRTWPRR